MSDGTRRERARAVADRLLDRFADPDATVAACRIPADQSDDGRAWPLWEDLALSNGYPGVALALSGTVLRDKRQAAIAHRHLARAMAAVENAGESCYGIYGGAGAVAFATLAAHRQTGGYVSALRGLDAYVRRLVRVTLPSATDGPARTNAEFEVVRGVSGAGRYLLARGDECAGELELVLSYLVSMACGEVPHQGHKVPRWWTLAAPRSDLEARLPGGHLNLGLSHGVAGPLALLSLAWEAGRVVEGHQEAIERIVGLLRDRRSEDEYGVYWPGFVSLHEWAEGRADPGTRPRPSWCYGVPGVSRAVQLAALALGRDDWHDLARASVLAFLASPRDRWNIDDTALCHGWSGLLHLLGLLNRHIDDERLTRARDEIVDVIVARFDEDLPFGLRFTAGADSPGFLEGSGGVALALDAYAEDRSAVGWDEALLVA
ncbi:lanthionine synthetase C family protein [Actinoallomurus vinaceus]|uniref:Lanthionine synthetase C family protein n=1 Tax=Actinoallomurus vinaceus TaxID=1080074 RepID=A0ABP8UN12_9ACTN